jgi:hypothetical protein
MKPKPLKTKIKPIGIIVIIIILLSLLVFIFASCFGKYLNIYDYEFPNFENLTKETVAYTCCEEDYVYNCYITPSTVSKKGVICVGCSNITYLFKCFPHIKKCLLIEKYLKIR